MGPRWSHYNREHLHYFCRGTIARLLLCSGFQVAGIERAPKFLTLGYLCKQLARQASGAQFFSLVHALLPDWIKNHDFSVDCGSMCVVADRVDAPESLQ